MLTDHFAHALRLIWTHRSMWTNHLQRGHLNLSHAHLMVFCYKLNSDNSQLCAFESTETTLLLWELSALCRTFRPRSCGSGWTWDWGIIQQTTERASSRGDWRQVSILGVDSARVEMQLLYWKSTCFWYFYIFNMLSLWWFSQAKSFGMLYLWAELQHWPEVPTPLSKTGSNTQMLDLGGSTLHQTTENNGGKCSNVGLVLLLSVSV